MNDKIQSRPINPTRTLDSLFPSRFLKSNMLDEWGMKSIVVTITRIVEELVEPKPKQKEWKAILYFSRANEKTEHSQGYLLTAIADKEALKIATRTNVIGDVIGKQIRIIQAKWRGRDILRIDPKPVLTPSKPKPKTKPKPDPNPTNGRENKNQTQSRPPQPPMPDEIPF